MNEWVPSKLQGKIHVKHGFPFESEYFNKTGELVVLTPGNFYEEGGFKRNADKDKCYSHTFPPEYLLEKGDLIVAMTQQADGLLGSMAIVPESGKFLHNQRIGLVTATSNDVCLEYIFHLFKTKWIRKQIRLTSTGSKVKHTSPEKIYDLDVVLPELSAQEEIAKILSMIDTKMDLNRRINDQLERMVRLLYEYWFVQFDFPITSEQASWMKSPMLEGKPYRASGGKMVYNKILKRELPLGWEDGSLEQLGRIVGGSTPSTETPEFFSNNGMPWITPNDLSDNLGRRFIDHGAMDVTAEGIKSASLKVLPKGTVLLSSRAPIGYLAIARKPTTTNQGFKSFVPMNGFSSDYIYFTLNHYMKLIKANASGSTFKEISGGTLKAVKIHLPPRDLLEGFDAAVLAFSEQQSVLESQNQQLASLRDWLLPMLMNGQATIREAGSKKNGH